MYTHPGWFSFSLHIFGDGAKSNEDEKVVCVCVHLRTFVSEDIPGTFINEVTY